jgi:amino acid adenylation domain-containing protein
MILSLPHTLAQTAARYPQQQAVRYGSQWLTYAALYQQSCSLARVLRQQGVQRGDRVGVYMPKRLEAVIACYGIMQAGAAYVPLDPWAPVARVGQMMADCGLRHLVSAATQLPQVRQLLTTVPLECLIGVPAMPDVPVPCLSWQQVLATTAAPSADLEAGEHDLAYILYTSGSTGAPKGIVHTHSSALAFAQWAAHAYGISPADRVSNHAPLHFDLSTFDLFAAALGGATTVIIPEYLTRFPRGLAQLMAMERISVWYSVPFALIQLLQHGNLLAHNLRALRWVLFAGEPFPSKHLRCLMAVLPQARYSNLYGPTETNVCTYYHVEPESIAGHMPIPIGRPCAGTDTLVVDEQMQPVAAGAVGELLVCGPTLMRSYWGRPDLDARSFYHCVGSDGDDHMFYRTGDLVQRGADGHYYYLGRKDRQIKTRGYRVELEAIETVLVACDAVQEAAVYTVPTSGGTQGIAAAVMPKPGAVLTARMLRQHAARALPAYAIPDQITISEGLPRTSTGKIDRRALQQRVIAHAATVVAQEPVEGRE